MQERQTTIAEPFSVSGVGVHTGQAATLTFQPASADTGIVFQRLDLPGQPKIRADENSVDGSARCTRIGKGEATVSTIEHVMAALAGLQIDNCHLSLDGPEVPIIDGSARLVAQNIQRVGVVPLAAARKKLILPHPVWVSEGNSHAVAVPSDEFRVSFTFTNDKGLKFLSDQFAEFVITPEVFLTEIAGARTMGWLSEVQALQKRGLIKGGSMDIAVIIGEDGILTPLRYENELVRHKILDLVGDLALIGPLCAHIIAIRSGHKLNSLLARSILEVVR